MIGIDTNVLIRFLVQDDPKQAKVAQRFLNKECTREHPGWINRVVLCELVLVLERLYRSSISEVADVLEQLAQTAEFKLEDLPQVWEAIRLYRDGRCDFADALIVASNRVRGCEATVTFDRKMGGNLSEVILLV